MNVRAPIQVFAALLVFAFPLAAESGLVIDRIVATVDGEPITLSDVVSQLPGKPPEDFSAAKNHPAFRPALDALISEKLLSLESEERRINVTDGEIDAYVENVANHNQLSLEEFREALVKEGRTFDQFKKSVRMEILKSKLANSMMKEGGGVTDSEVAAYIEENYGNSEEGSKQLKLRQVLVRTEGDGSEALATCKKVSEEFKEGTPFADLAKEYSQSQEAKNGGDLGVFEERDLNPVIFDAVLTVKAGEISEVTRSPLGCHVFYVEERFDSSVDSAKLEEEVREKLNQQKVEERFQTYFSSEIYKNHTVEKKV